MSCSKIVRTKLNEIVQNIRKMDKDTNECNEIMSLSLKTFCHHLI